jgi:glycosyltransferase involved in cell wall biosynthesis
VHVDASPSALLRRAEKVLWPNWVALAAAGWTGDHGPWALKLAPLLVPPFHALFVNARGDFFPGTPGCIIYYNWRALRDAADSGFHRAADLAGGVWRLLTYHVWRAGPCVRARDVAASSALWCLATLLRLFAYPHRRWFHRLHGDRRLHPIVAVSEGADIAAFTQRGPDWQGDELAALVRSSHARWILWTEHGATQAADDMLPLFDDDRTFAVARQVDYRGWNRHLAVPAPFRTLQPGEATRVLAPLSNALLVDRRKLAALGIPGCSLTGAAWMLLFWKAAAAGWRSYSIGQARALGARPDAPMEEASFLLSVLGSETLRGLGPAEPSLTGGNIAFLPAPRRARQAPSGRLRVLVVSPFLPFPLSHGGAVRIYNLCGALAPRVDFALTAIREKDENVDYARLHQVFREVRVVDLDETASPDRRLPRQVRHHRSKALRALIGEVADTWRPDVLQIEYTHMAGFGDSAPGVPSLLVEHDLTFSLYRQLADAKQGGSAETAESWREYERWRAFEHAWLRAFDGVWTMSEEDRQAAIAAGGRPPELTFHVPNGVDTERFRPRPEPSGAPTVLYVGSFRHLPNLIGFEALCREIMPRVWARHPGARLCVVAGPRYEEYWQRGEIDPRIEIHGFVEDPRPLYATANVVAAPLAVSAGTNIKVLEAMACGKAMVSTSTGCAGLGCEDGRELLVRDGWDDFAAGVSEALGSSGLRRRLGAGARAAAERRFSWEAIAECGWQSYLRLSGRARRRARRAG